MRGSHIALSIFLSSILLTNGSASSSVMLNCMVDNGMEVTCQACATYPYRPSPPCHEYCWEQFFLQANDVQIKELFANDAALADRIIQLRRDNGAAAFKDYESYLTENEYHRFQNALEVVDEQQHEALVSMQSDLMELNEVQPVLQDEVTQSLTESDAE